MRWTARLCVVNHYLEYIKQCQPNAQVWAASSKYLCKLEKKKKKISPGRVNCKRCPFWEDQIEKETTFVGTINKKHPFSSWHDLSSKAQAIFQHRVSHPLRALHNHLGQPSPDTPLTHQDLILVSSLFSLFYFSLSLSLSR